MREGLSQKEVDEFWILWEWSVALGENLSVILSLVETKRGWVKLGDVGRICKMLRLRLHQVS